MTQLQAHRFVLGALALALVACGPGSSENGATLTPGCQADRECPKDYFCVGGACQLVPGCSSSGCSSGQVCDASSQVCVAADAGVAVPPADGGLVNDAGTVPPSDAGMGDAGTGGPPDAGVTGAPDAGNGGAGALTNGTFEDGSLGGWTTSGVTSVVTTAHGGGFAAQVGSTGPSTDSSIQQQIVLPAGTPLLSFWYKIVCPDAVDFDWATAVVTSTSGTVLATPLPQSCNNAGWTQASADLTAWAGQTVVIALENHDDNNASDPTYTLYDDVAISNGSAGNTPDFSLSASPASLTGAGSATVSASPSSGFASTIALSTIGLPSGATGSLSTTSLSTSGSATLTLAPGTAAAGTYPLVVTGNSGSLTHTANISWTIASVASPDFTLTASPSSVSGAGSSTIAIAGTGGFSGTVSLAVSGAPSGGTASLGSSSLTSARTTGLTLTPGSAAAGTYPLTIAATSGALSHSATVSWTIAAAACTTDTWNSWASGFMSKNCAGCHSWANSYSSVGSHDCRRYISDDSMPRGATLSAAEKARILKWLNCGSPQ